MMSAECKALNQMRAAPLQLSASQKWSTSGDRRPETPQLHPVHSTKANVWQGQGGGLPICLRHFTDRALNALAPLIPISGH